MTLFGIRKAIRSDSLALGVIVMLVVSVAQRGVGFTRSMLFCGMMQDDELGRWSLAFSFLLLAAPLIVIGIPGTFGRYVEHYRQQGKLRALVRYTATTCSLLLAVAIFAMLIFRQPLSWLIFHDSNQSTLIVSLCAALIVVTAANYLVELLMAMRYVRAVSLLQFGNSILFAGVGVGLLWCLESKVTAVIIGYAAGSLWMVLGSIWVLCRAEEQPSAMATDSEFKAGRMWAKLLPFAGWIWVTNLLANLFDAADRFMIVHWAPVGNGADALVGQYHSSRVVPMMLVALAGMLSGVILPYLSQDWESQRRERLSLRMNTIMKLSAVGFTFAGSLVLWLSPLLFDWLLQGRYNEGLSVLPLTMTYSIWFSLICMVQNYLWCAERPGVASFCLAIGLLLNLICNWLWLPVLGLTGAVLATAGGNLIALALTLYCCHRAGHRWDVTSVCFALLPLAILLGPLPSLLSCCLAAALTCRDQLLATWFAEWRHPQHVPSV